MASNPPTLKKYFFDDIQSRNRAVESVVTIYYFMIFIVIILVFIPLLFNALNVIVGSHYIYYIVFYTITTMIFLNVKIFLEARDIINMIKIKKIDNINISKRPLSMLLIKIFQKAFSILSVSPSSRRLFPNIMSMKLFWRGRKK